MASCRDEAPVMGVGDTSWLHQVIAQDDVLCLNAEEGDIKAVIRKGFDDRLDEAAGWVYSPDDEDNELLVHVPFTNPVSLFSFYAIGGDGRRGNCHRKSQEHSHGHQNQPLSLSRDSVCVLVVATSSSMYS